MFFHFLGTVKVWLPSLSLIAFFAQWRVLTTRKGNGRAEV